MKSMREMNICLTEKGKVHAEKLLEERKKITDL